MAADHIITIAAAPFLILIFQKFSDSVLPDEFEVFYHTQVIFGTIALVEGFQAFTGKVPAFVAEPDQPVTEQFAVFFHEDTIIAARYAAPAIHSVKPVLFKVVFHRQVVDAQSAVHTAGSNQLFFHTCIFVPFQEHNTMKAGYQSCRDRIHIPCFSPEGFTVAASVDII